MQIHIEMLKQEIQEKLGCLKIAAPLGGEERDCHGLLNLAGGEQ